MKKTENQKITENLENIIKANIPLKQKIDKLFKADYGTFDEVECRKAIAHWITKIPQLQPASIPKNLTTEHGIKKFIKTNLIYKKSEEKLINAISQILWVKLTKPKQKSNGTTKRRI